MSQITKTEFQMHIACRRQQEGTTSRAVPGQTIRSLKMQTVRRLTNSLPVGGTTTNLLSRLNPRRKNRKRENRRKNWGWWGGGRAPHDIFKLNMAILQTG